jgi:hypothetical protein
MSKRALLQAVMVVIGAMGSRHENSHHTHSHAIRIRISAYVPSHSIAKIRDTPCPVHCLTQPQFDKQHIQHCQQRLPTLPSIRAVAAFLLLLSLLSIALADPSLCHVSRHQQCPCKGTANSACMQETSHATNHHRLCCHLSSHCIQQH